MSSFHMSLCDPYALVRGITRPSTCHCVIPRTGAWKHAPVSASIPLAFVSPCSVSPSAGLFCWSFFFFFFNYYFFFIKYLPLVFCCFVWVSAWDFDLDNFDFKNCVFKNYKTFKHVKIFFFIKYLLREI
jgi:hypothetical protein